MEKNFKNKVVYERYTKFGQKVVRNKGSFTNDEGEVVEYDTTTAGTVITGTDGTTVPAGVAYSGRRLSRSQTDNSIAVGEPLDIVTKGEVYVTASASSIGIGISMQKFNFDLAFISLGDGGNISSYSISGKF